LILLCVLPLAAASAALWKSVSSHPRAPVAWALPLLVMEKNHLIETTRGTRSMI
jgi:hypothetical protein